MSWRQQNLTAVPLTIRKYKLRGIEEKTKRRVHTLVYSYIDVLSLGN